MTRSHFVPVLVRLILTPRRQIDYEDDDEDENEWTVQAFQERTTLSNIMEIVLAYRSSSYLLYRKRVR